MYIYIYIYVFFLAKSNPGRQKKKKLANVLCLLNLGLIHALELKLGFAINTYNQVCIFSLSLDFQWFNNCDQDKRVQYCFPPSNVAL